MTSGIYSIVNKINGHRYVGSAIDISDRWRKHKYELRKGTHHSKYLLNSWKKNGEDNFDFIVIEECEIDKLIEREQFYLDQSFPEYNTNKIAGSLLGFRFSEETKKQMSIVHTGFRHTEESKKKMSEIWSGKPRGKYSEERCKKLSESHKGKIPNENQKAALEIGRKRSPTEEERKRISESNRGQKRSQETIDKLKAARSKRITTEETKIKTSESMKRYWENKRAAS
jgi:group I intron endonuclease